MTPKTLQTKQALQARIAQLERELDACQREKESLRVGEARFRSYFELPLAGRAITSPTKGWVEVNATLCDMLGYTPDELRRMTWTELTHPDDLAADVTQFNRVMAGEINGFTMEKRFVRKDGQIVQVDLAVHCVRRAEGAVEYFVALVHNITERKRAEEAMRASGHQHYTILETAMDGFWQVDLLTGKIIEVNQAYCQMSGYTREELMTMTIPQLEVIEDTAQINEHIQRVVTQGADRFETLHRRKDGSTFQVEISVTYLPIAGGRSVAFLRDITERKQAEMALRASEARFREAIEFLPIPLGLADKQGNILHYNRKFTECYGYTAQDIPTIDDWMTHAYPNPEYRQFIQSRWSEEFAQSVRDNTATSLREFQVTCKDGGQRDVEIIARTMGDLLVSSFNDVTERKRAEARLRRFWDLPLIGMAITAPDRRFLEVNQKLADLFGYAVENLIGMSWVDLTHPDDVAENLRLLEQTLAGETDGYEMDKRFIRRDGSLVYTHIAARCIRRADGMVDHLALVIQDITERQQVQAKLRESEEKFETAFHASPSAVSLTSLEEGRYLDVNDTFLRLVERTREEVIGHTSLEVGIWSSQAQRNQILSQIKERGAVHNAELELPTKSGKLLSIIFSADRVTISNVPCLIVSWVDITERKQRERELEAVTAMSAAMRQARTRAEMLPIIADEVTNLVNAASVALIFSDDQTNDYVIDYAQGVWTSEQGKHLPRTAGILRHVLEQGKPYLTNDLPNDPHFIYRDSIRDLRAMVEISLRTHEAIIGFLAVGSKNTLTESDVRVLTAISDIAANAIHRAALHERTENYAADLRHAYDTTLEGWAHALELRDQETEGHTRRVVKLTIELARAMGVSESDLEHLRWGALLHDIGKMGIPDSVLLKPGTLNEREWEIMRRHAEFGYQLLQPIEYLRPALDIPYCHHEKWDGTGYPRGLQGEAIPLAARIFAVVDVWDALCSDRPYRAAWSYEQARAYVSAQSEKHFDPRVLEAFLKMV